MARIWSDEAKLAYYRTFPDRTEPDAYERTLLEVFPDFAPGSFTWVPELGRWAWTTFNTYQWDLDYSNPEVFRAMAEVIVKTAEATDRAIRCLRNMDPGFHEHAVEVNRLENSADNLLRDSLAALFDEGGDPIEVIKWKEIYETMEIVTDRCEDVANVIEGIILKMA